MLTRICLDFLRKDTVFLRIFCPVCCYSAHDPSNTIFWLLVSGDECSGFASCPLVAICYHCFTKISFCRDFLDLKEKASQIVVCHAHVMCLTVVSILPYVCVFCLPVHLCALWTQVHVWRWGTISSVTPLVLSAFSDSFSCWLGNWPHILNKLAPEVSESCLPLPVILLMWAITPGFWGQEQGPECLQGKGFTDWVISPTVCVFRNNIFQFYKGP